MMSGNMGQKSVPFFGEINLRNEDLRDIVFPDSVGVSEKLSSQWMMHDHWIRTDLSSAGRLSS